MTAVGTASGSHPSAARLAPGFQLGDYRLGQPLFPLRIADAYKAEGPTGAATIYVVHARIAQHASVRDQVIAGTRAAAQMPEQKHLVRTLAAGLTGDFLWIATEEVDGSLVRDLLAKKKQAGSAGLGTRASGNLIGGVATALADVHHGALASESVVVSRTGRVRVIDLALGPGTAAAIVAGLLPTQYSIAPEILAGASPTGAADVYGVGALLYEALVGTPLEKGGPRPSDVVNGVNLQIDEVVARACHRDPTKRFGRADVLGEVVAEALNKGGAMQTSAVPLLESAPGLAQQVSLAASIAGPATAVDPAAPSPAASGSAIDRALAVALADTTEKWLVSKGRLDYGPFSLADIVAQIEKGDIVAGNVIMDKDSGARSDVGAHPLLAPMIEQSRMRRDDQRRAQAEVAVQKRDKKRGVVLYAMIGAGVLGLSALVYFVIVPALSDEKKEEVKQLTTLEGAKLEVKLMPKRPPPENKRPAGSYSGGNNSGSKRPPPGARPPPGGWKNDDTTSFDLSDESDGDGPESLSNQAVYAVYSRYGGSFAGCLGGGGSANIFIAINPAGYVTAVKINNQTSGPLYTCLAGVMRSMKFPPARGRTRVEFDISM